MKMNIKTLGVVLIATLIIFLSIYYIQLSFLDKTPSELVALFKLSSIYFLVTCVVCLVLLELMRIYVADKLAMGFLVLMMMKLGGYVMLYMNGPELPKWMRLMIILPMFIGIFIEVGYLYYRISNSESKS